MIQLLVNPEDVIKVSFYVGTSKTNKDTLYVDETEELLKNQAGDDLGVFENYNVTFRPPNYGSAIKILDKSIRLSGDDITINSAEIRQSRFITLLKDWDLKDQNGKPIEPTKENINNLHPLIAAVITIGLDKELQDRGLL